MAAGVRVMASAARSAAACSACCSSSTRGSLERDQVQIQPGGGDLAADGGELGEGDTAVVAVGADDDVGVDTAPARRQCFGTGQPERSWEGVETAADGERGVFGVPRRDAHRSVAGLDGFGGHGRSSTVMAAACW